MLFKCANHRKERPFVSTANEAVVGTFLAIGDDIFAIANTLIGVVFYSIVTRQSVGPESLEQ